MPSLNHFISNASIPYDENLVDEKSLKTKRNISEALNAILKQEKKIRLARIILRNGLEYIRIERNAQTLKNIPPNLMQSKENRLYFKIGMTLSRDDIYVSKISPNYEHGVVEYPIWPTYRIIKPLINKDNLTIGIIVFNIDASEMLNELNELNENHVSTTADIESYLIDSNGFYLAAPNNSLLFGGELSKKNMNWFNHTEQQIPLSTSAPIETQFMGKPYIVSLQEIRISSYKNQFYYLLTTISKDIINLEIQQQRKELLISILVFVILIFIIISFFFRYIKHLEKLYLDQSRFKAIIASSSDAIISIDTNGDIISWNHSATLLFGLSKSEAMGMCFFDLLSQTENTPLNYDALENIISSKSNTRIEVSPKYKQKSHRTLLLTLCPIEKIDGYSALVALIIRDISYEKENKQKLESMNNALDIQVKKRTEELEHEKRKAQKANQIKSMFIANISHEIRTPLNGINGLLSLARDKTNHEKQDDYLKMAQDSAKTLNILINDLLDLSKIESGKLELNPQAFDLIDLLENVISSSSFLIINKNIELILDVSRVEESTITLDEHRIKQILTNLLSNAIKFTNQGEVILTASTYRHDNNPNIVLCEFQVSDTGVGITEEQQAKLFKPFTQASSGIANKYGGTGLGLSISKQLCELMKGSLTLSSKYGEGSNFKATLRSSILKSDAIEDNKLACVKDLNIAVFVQNDHVRRVLRKQLLLWNSNCLPVSNIDDFYPLVKNNSVDYALIDYELFTKDLNDYLESRSITVIYLAKILQDTDLKLDTRILTKPIIPSMLFSALSNNIKEPALIVEDTFESSPKNTSSEASSQIVFVVDDNEINRIVGKGILSALPITVETAINGEDILQKLANLKQSKTLPVILMDCQMPIMDGYECARLIREGKAGAWLEKAPIIAMTADAMSENIIQCQEAGMDDFISKPFDPDKLKEMTLSWSQKKPC